jgi:ApaG protein
METQITHGIRVSVEHQYQPAHSEPQRNHYLHVYDITIENRNSFPVQLMRRQWLIDEDSGVRNEVIGDGVIGVQPVIQPGGIHAYSSYCVLASEIGRMHGRYIMVRLDENTEFEVDIPAFVLALPAKMN